MIGSLRILCLALACAVVSVHAAGLPDTGQDICYNDTVADVVSPGSLDSIARDTGTHPRQDCRYGQDPAANAGLLTKTGAGGKGFDYTKIANNGTALAASAQLGTASTEWTCTRDNNTGLTWEVRTITPTNVGLRYYGHLYSWFDSDSSRNGGNAGGTGTNTCNNTLPGSLCNTQAYVTAVNAAALCTHTDWRMPSRRELLTLIAADGTNTSVDPAYFPDTQPLPYWSGTSYVPVPANAWSVYFGSGSTNNAVKTTNAAVRLVRGAQF